MKRYAFVMERMIRDFDESLQPYGGFVLMKWSPGVPANSF